MGHAMKTERTKEGKVVIYDASTGQRLERWPVDARAMVASGEFVEFPPSGEPDTVPETRPSLDPAEVESVKPVAAAPVLTPAPHPDALGITPLPSVTPTGAPAVHSTAADAAPAVPLGDQPIRRSRGRRAQ